MAEETYHAYIVDTGKPVRTFNALDLAEAYREKMADLGAEVRLQRIPVPGGEEIEDELTRQQLENLP